MYYLLGFSGKAGSGKDTVAKAVMEEFDRCGIQYLHLPLAKVLKDMAMELWGYTWDEVYNTKPPHVRKNLQRLGTEIVRSRDEGFWIRQVKRIAQASARQVVNGPLFVLVSDVRFANEARFIADNGILVRVRRPVPTPANKLTDEALQHASELEMETIPDEMFKIVINNDFPTVQALSNYSGPTILGVLLRQIDGVE